MPRLSFKSMETQAWTGSELCKAPVGTSHIASHTKLAITCTTVLILLNKPLARGYAMIVQHATLVVVVAVAVAVAMAVVAVTAAMAVAMHA